MSPRLALVTDHPLAHGGGRERSIIELYRSMTRIGHDVTIIAPPDLGRTGRAVDAPFLPTLRIKETTERLLQQGLVDVAIYNAENLLSVISQNAKLRKRQVLFVRDVEEVGRWRAGAIPETVGLLANSRFVARRIDERTGRRAEVVEPQFDFPQDRPRASGGHVTFINPVRQKGLYLACEIAALLPQLRFRFVEGWKPTAGQRSELERALAGLPNVEFAEWRRDVAAHYLQSRALLVPSLWEEGFGRVAVEANAYGVPVLASDIGGLPEAVGAGGVLLSPSAGAEVWAEALERIVSEGEDRARLLDGAAANAAYHVERSRTAAQRVIDLVSPRAAASDRSSGPGLPCVDVIMTHFNYSKFIGNAISSVQEQSYGNFRLTIIDDLSSEEERRNLVSIVEGFDDPRINLVLSDENKGQIGAFFDAFGSTDSEFVALLDPDDVYDRDFLKLMLSAHLNPLWTVGIASCEMVTFAHGSGDLTKFFSRTRQKHRLEGRDDDQGFMQDCFGYAKYYPPTEKAWIWGTTSSLMCRRSFIQNIVPKAGIGFRFDLDTYLSFGCHVQGGTVFVDHALAGRGRHGANVAFADEVFSDAQNRNKVSFESGYAALRIYAMQRIAEETSMTAAEIVEFSKLLPQEDRVAFLKDLQWGA